VAPNDQYGLINSPRVGFTNYNTLINSSALDRTLVTGNRFMEGVFPGQSSPPVPIYSVQETEDYRIRGYTRCPSYQRRLTDWYASDEFKQKEVETQVSVGPEWATILCIYSCYTCAASPGVCLLQWGCCKAAS
jgi:hypothetical protein